MLSVLQPEWMFQNNQDQAVVWNPLLLIVLIRFNRSISFPLHPENPFTINDIESRTRWNKLSCLFINKSLVFFFHSYSPVRLSQGNTKMFRFHRRIWSFLDKTCNWPRSYHCFGWRIPRMALVIGRFGVYSGSCESIKGDGSCSLWEFPWAVCAEGRVGSEEGGICGPGLWAIECEGDSLGLGWPFLRLGE